MKFEITSKPVGKKTLFTVLMDGKAIGTRTSAAQYHAAVVLIDTEARRQWDMANALKNAEYQCNVAAEYEAVVRGEKPLDRGRTVEDYAKWADGCRAMAARYVAAAESYRTTPLRTEPKAAGCWSRSAARLETSPEVKMFRNQGWDVVIVTA